MVRARVSMEKRQLGQSPTLFVLDGLDDGLSVQHGLGRRG
jgi:hypothetical protein